MATMKLVRDINVFSDEVMHRRMVVTSMGVMIAGAALCLLWACSGEDLMTGSLLLWIVGTLAATAVAFVAHELVHALFFKILGGSSVRITFGYKAGMLYTNANGAELTPGRFIVTLLAPTVIISVATLVAGWLSGQPFAGFIVFILHLSGCSGDACMAQAVAMTPDVDIVKDTDTGVACYSYDEFAPTFQS